MAVASLRPLGRVVALICCCLASIAGAAPPPDGTRRVLALDVPQGDEMAALRHSNRREAGRRKALRIGFGREFTQDLSERRIAPSTEGWQRFADGWRLEIAVRSPQAAGLRVELRVSSEFPGLLRFHGERDPVGGTAESYTASDWLGQSTYWGPVTAGDTATLEVVVPESALAGAWHIDLLRVSHLVTLPTDRDAYGNLYPDTGRCEINVACTTATDEVAAAKAVAHMSFVDAGDSYVCTGAWVANTADYVTPYFYTAHHCVSSQTVANTLNTYWNFQDSACSGKTDPYSSYKRLTRGATYLDSEEDNDHSFLKLNESMPTNASPLAWDLADLTAGTRVMGIHHPNGDVKKISYGSVDQPAATSSLVESDSGDLIEHSSVWRVKWQRGVTESGSSGAPLLTCDGSTCKLRGGLIGGYSECSISEGPDDFSKFGRAYARIKRWLAPSATAVASSTEIDCLLAWAENSYPELFAPSGGASLTASVYRYRYYAGTGAYLGVSSQDDSVYYLGALSDNALFNLGAASIWLSRAACR